MGVLRSAPELLLASRRTILNQVGFLRHSLGWVGMLSEEFFTKTPLMSELDFVGQ